ncbi:hypothetical protein RF11_11732 [Thelohanellus kitauei]|uniref:Uncharacterized protein n=1 Tax=Thelohanellus kitauei TaxID=669202 RepID=A0A0C2IM16_THEKT|nr:hypothetical protein RF11_11732 [Thelohanellus kitauei]
MDLHPGSPFYYLNTIDDTRQILARYSIIYNSGIPGFRLPGVVELIEEFKGLDNFIFSETFLGFIMECFVNWYRKPESWKKTPPDLFPCILLCISFVLSVSKNRTICKTFHDRWSIFWGPHRRLANISFLDIMKSERPSNQNPLVMPMTVRFTNPIAYMY